MPPISCPDGDEPRYRFTKSKKGVKRRIAICGSSDVVENVAFKKDAKGKLKRALADGVKDK